jgi:tRNA(fMet)-specific endonuclease VapC
MLDTNAVSALAKGGAASFAARLDHQPFCLSVITEAELRFGLARRPVNADLRRIVDQFLRAADIRPWSSACAERYAVLRTELEKRGTPLAPMDLMIAAHALAESCTLVTADRAFSEVPGLQLVDWPT